MSLSPVLINGTWRSPESPIGEFQAQDPSLKKTIPEIFPISSFKDIKRAVDASISAVEELRLIPPEKLGKFLETYAENINNISEPLIEKAAQETGLPIIPRLRDVELPRTIDQLKQAASAAQDGSWCCPTIDTQLNIRSKYGPLGGPVVTFGPNNFPLAFNSISGGDFAAAIAAGNPVISKSNPNHPGTTRLFAEAARNALNKSELPPSTIQLLYHFNSEDGFRLVSHPKVSATAFTGNRKTGLPLKKAAEEAGNLIYLELSSINPVFILPGALEERAQEIAEQLFESCTLGMGQFCTNPGLVVVMKNKKSKVFLETLKHLFKQEPAGTLLGERVLEDLKDSIETLKKNGARIICGGKELKGNGCRFSYTLLSVSGKDFLKRPLELQKEAFGPSTLLVNTEGADETLKIIKNLQGNLTGTLYTNQKDQDDSLYKQFESALRPKVGRLLNNKMPTGVAVTSAMHHGGPFPASGHPGFTSVGIPTSIKRFASLYCYDNVNQKYLPIELKNKNPSGKMWRFIDRVWTQKSI
ncbi:MAG: aldehyde dehydrogenase (NADP(+)) [Acidobacteriota bacterium]